MSILSSLRVRLLILVLLVITPLLGLLLYTASEERRTAYEEAQENLIRVVRIIANDQERLIDGTRQLLIVLAQLAPVRDGDAKACGELFSRIDREYQIFADLGVVGADGYVFCGSRPMTKKTYVGDQYYFKRALETREFVAGDHQRAQRNEIPSLSFAYPVIDDAGKLRAVVFAAIDLRWLNRFAFSARLPEGAVVQMINGQGQLLVRFPELAKAEDKPVAQAPFVKAILAQRGEGTTEYVDADGALRLYAYRPVAGLGEKEVYVAIGNSKKILFSKGDQNLRFNLIAIAISSLVAFGVAWIAADLLFLRKTDKLMEATRRIAGGDLSSRTGLVDGKDELVELAKSFDAMAEMLQLREIQNQNAEREIRTLNEELEQRVKQRTAELEAANKELESFSYSVSHDLRAPLRGIHGFSQALLEDYQDKLDEQGKDYLGRICAAGQKLSLLIDDLLQLSRVTRSELRGEVVDLTDMAKSIATELQASQNGRKVEFHIADRMATHGDARLLRVALVNLLSNAWKFTAKNPGAKIEFGTGGSNGKQSYFVRDNGAGFDMTYADKLFRPFQRLHDDAEFDGTGIGLATVQRIIRRHGGQIWAEAGIGKGATFYFTL